MNDKHVIIVGAGMSGLTAAVYLARTGFNVQIIEKNKECGGLLNSFQREGFLFDGGARSILNSGIIRPMLKQIGIQLELLPSPVTIGIEKKLLNITSKNSIQDYKHILEELYPESINDIEKIIIAITNIMNDMEVLYGFDNPNFRDLKHDRDYLLKELLPWLGKFLGTLRRINKLTEPVEDYLEKLSQNKALIDIIDQHFFKKTPTFFALGYFYVYLDYFYPKGGTGELPKALKQKILELGGKIQTETQITEVIPSDHIIKDKNGNSYPYDELIWCADLKSFYRIMNHDKLPEKTNQKINLQKQNLYSKRGGDSIFELFIGVDEPPEKFKAIHNGHFFYTPSKQGLEDTHRSQLTTLIENFENTTKEKVLEWLSEYCRLNTYEISIPALRDPSLAPNGKTGLIVSLLFEYRLMKKIQEAGWLNDFKGNIENQIIDTMTNSIYPFMKNKILFRFSSTPLTIAEIFESSEGAITGWSYELPVPVVNKLQKIGNSVKTPVPNVLQAGQWAYSPAGIPTAILTGWYAAQNIIKKHK